ncbi:MAG: branched-chain amino acid ABC transporter permease [Nitriliruptorales bacterium]|nr:branched-chain amino acid ABC transporter permease [Nitriliruptorales bacterium]
MELFFQQLINGLATGAIYASLAVALVLIYRSTDIVNFAQGEMAMFSAYIAWALTQAGWGFWPAVIVTLIVSFIGGLAVERVVIRPVEGQNELTIVIVTIGLFIFFNALAGWIWTFQVRGFPSPFPQQNVDLGPVSAGIPSLGIVAVVAAVVGLLFLLFQRTKLGLTMRAAAENPESSRLVGIRVGWMLALGWGLAATVGAISGILVAPILFLSPNMMAGVLIFAFAAATLGGFDSAGGAVIGGLIVGVSESLAGTYIGFIGADLKIVIPMAIIVGVLLVKPEGLFGRPSVERV